MSRYAVVIPLSDPNLLPLSVVGAMLGYRDRKNRAIRRMIAEGVLPARRLPGSRAFKIKLVDVTRLIEASRLILVPEARQDADQDFSRAVRDVM